MYKRQELTKYYTRDYMEPGRVVLKCENIADGKMVKGASFELREGEIIGFAGDVYKRQMSMCKEVVKKW